ncbi:phage tail protein [Pleionea mediterranea]|uniref:Microcystin-dependent protein n=1 Tax=Pleionea mediterranea TaxID=523701 RepID=A0A316FPP5_9GAMM|nr:tail fiber protein [Pleionea mediterranea]PWK50751.1 microcystin-dependent protein [Pleionea mediterranea]
MAEPFLSEIRMWGFGWPPRGWQECDGQLMQISQNEALFSLLGTTFGGDGRSSFGLPDLRGRSPMHSEEGEIQLGERAGTESVTLNVAEMPVHTHTLRGSTEDANANDFSGRVLAAGYQTEGRPARRGPKDVYGSPNNLVPLNSQSVSNAGGNLPHNNMQPSLVVNFCIAVTGLFPSRN